MIYEILKRYEARGKANALAMKFLCGLTGLTPRQVKKQVQNERQRHIICSRKDNQGGYYRPATIDEIGKYDESFRALIIEHAKTARLAHKLLKRTKAV